MPDTTHLHLSLAFCLFSLKNKLLGSKKGDHANLRLHFELSNVKLHYEESFSGVLLDFHDLLLFTHL